MATISERIKHAMVVRNMKQVDLVNITGIGKSSISTYLAGNYKPKQQNIHKIAKALDVSEAWLMGFDVPMERNENKTNLIPIDFDTQFVKIPVIGRVAAGAGCFVNEEIIGYEFTETKDIVPGETYRYLMVSGDSMEPKIEDGDLILVRQQASVDSGSIAVVSIDDTDGVVKRVNYGHDWIELKSINPKYPPRVFEGEDVLRIRVLGLVKQIKRKLD